MFFNDHSRVELRDVNYVQHGAFYDAFDGHLFILTITMIMMMLRWERVCQSSAWKPSFSPSISPMAYLAWEGVFIDRIILTMFLILSFIKWRLSFNDNKTMMVMDNFRFPINFKSEVEETSLLSGRKFFYHVVLGIAYKGGQLDNSYSIFPSLKFV